MICLFLSTSRPNTSYQVLSQMAFWFISSAKQFLEGGHLGFLIGTILAIFDLRCPDTSNQVSSQLASVQKKCKTNFQAGSHLGFLIRMILAPFALPFAPILPSKFRVNGPFNSGEEALNTVSRWWPF